MKKTELSHTRLQHVISDLSKYFNMVHSIDDAEFEIYINHNRRVLWEAYEQYIASGEDAEEIIDTLSAVSNIIQKNSDIANASMYQLLNNMVKPDLLKLYILLYDTSHKTTWLSLRTTNGTVRLRNYCNWFLDDMVKSYLKENLPNIHCLGEAVNELKRCRHGRGRLPSDPRIAQILWGSYTMLSEKCEFKSPMPNRLCQFLLVYLQILDLIPQDTEIDSFWIRAQLRYIRSKKERPVNQA